MIHSSWFVKSKFFEDDLIPPQFSKESMAKKLGRSYYVGLQGIILNKIIVCKHCCFHRLGTVYYVFILITGLSVYIIVSRALGRELSIMMTTVKIYSWVFV